MKIAGKTDIGMVRATNQDTFCIEALGQDLGLALVCDGMGGARGGDRASAMARRTITNVIRSGCREAVSQGSIHDLLLKALYEANRAIYMVSLAEPDCRGMGTTAVAALVTPDTAYVAHVGDSRLYQLRGEEFFQVTRDHSRVQEMVDEGSITPDEARVHPDRNMITRAVGVDRDVDVDLLDLPLQPGDKLLLCSDGLSGICTDREIAGVLYTLPAEEAVEELIHLANTGGGYDNITAVIVEL